MLFQAGSVTVFLLFWQVPDILGETETDKILQVVSLISGKFSELLQEVSLISGKLNEDTKLSQGKCSELKQDVDSLLKLSQDTFTEMKQDHVSLLKHANQSCQVLPLNEGYNELRVDMIYQGRRAYARYSNFYVASEALNYRLTVGAFEGTAGDSLTYHNNMYFSTFDRDNDRWGTNCAYIYQGAWWFNGCHWSDLNGLWGVQGHNGMQWYALTGYSSVSFSEMKIRRG